MKSYAATAILVAIAATLGLWLWLDRGHVTTGERRLRENDVVPSWHPDELTEITIAREGESLVLVREDHDGENRWRLSSPRDERADAAAVDRLLTTLEFATALRKVGDAKTLGFESPRAVASLRMGTLVVTLTLGGRAPRPEGASYLRVNDEAPIVVGKELADAMVASSDTYRDRAIVPYLATELARVHVTYPGGGFALERLDERSFRLDGASLLAARAAVDGMWNALAEMRAESFPKDADADRLTARPVATLTLTPKDPKRPPAEIVIGEACPGYPNDVVVLRRTPSRAAACAPKDVVAAFVVPPAKLVERRPFTLRRDEIEELSLELVTPVSGRIAGRAEAAPVAIEVARKGTGFHERSPVDRDLPADEADAVSELLAKIADFRVESVTRGAGPFTVTARARVRSGEHEEVIDVGPSDREGRAVLRRVSDDARLDAPPSLVRLLLPRETTLRSRRLVSDETRRPARVVLRCGTDQELVDRGEGFRLISPPGFESDGAITQLVDAVLRGRVDAWVSDVDDGTFGFTNDACRVVLAFEDDSAPITLWLGTNGEGGVYGRVSARSGVFVAPLSLRELAGRIYVSRGSLRAPASRITRVRATLGGRPVDGDVDELRDAVAALVADRVVSIGKRERVSDQRTPGPALVIDANLTEAGPPKRITCRASRVASEWLCAEDGLAAVFAVATTTLAPFFSARDAGEGAVPPL